MKNFFNGRLKETPYKVISYYHQEMDESQYLIITFFKLDEEVELFEPTVQLLTSKLGNVFEEMMKGNFKDPVFINKIENSFQSEIKFAIFQMERLSNLSKLQKVGLIFSTPERVRTLELLREGPISRKSLTNELEKIKDNPNINLILTPFLELNLVRSRLGAGNA